MIRALKGARAAAVTLGCALLSGGCATARVSLARGPRAYTAVTYPEVLTRWTREGTAYTLRGFLDDQLAVTSTFESWDFRWAYVVHYAADFHLTAEERTRVLRTSLDASEREHEFYVAVAIPTRRWGDLAAHTSGFRVLLVNDRNQEVLPTAIDPVRTPGVLERTYFPYTTPWRQVFRVRFPTRVNTPAGEVDIINARTQYFILRFAGPVGQLDLTWHVEG